MFGSSICTASDADNSRTVIVLLTSIPIIPRVGNQRRKAKPASTTTRREKAPRSKHAPRTAELFLLGAKARNPHFRKKNGSERSPRAPRTDPQAPPHTILPQEKPRVIPVMLNGARKERTTRVSYYLIRQFWSSPVSNNNNDHVLTALRAGHGWRRLRTHKGSFSPYILALFHSVAQYIHPSVS